MNVTLKPPLKWAGGKRWLVPHLRPIWERHSDRRYVEPFCGGLAVVLGLQPRRALLNDINPHLINFYSHLQSGMQPRVKMRYNEQLFYKHRERFNRLIQNGGVKSSEAAELLAQHPGPVVISNQATPRIVELYGDLGFELNYLDGPRRISCTGDRTAAREVLAIKE